jgi:hypothetical protein
MMTETNRARTARTLYGLAEQADARYSAVVAARTHGRRTRWTLTPDEARHPEIAAAYAAKVAADEAWLTFLRTRQEAQ